MRFQIFRRGFFKRGSIILHYFVMFMILRQNLKETLIFFQLFADVAGQKIVGGAVNIFIVGSVGKIAVDNAAKLRK
jgi:hypothetical protein